MQNLPTEKLDLIVLSADSDGLVLLENKNYFYKFLFVQFVQFLFWLYFQASHIPIFFT